MNRIDLKINPDILKWAREEAGYNTTEIADKISIPVHKYKTWEEQGENIPLGKLKLLARHCKRQLATFFLPSVPEKISRPKDFRNLSSGKSKLSKDVLMVIRDVTYFRQTALELQGESYWQSRYSWLREIENLKQDNKALATWLREKLNITIDDQIKWKSDDEAYRNWRQAVENQLGIFIFQFSMPFNEVHGFCYADNLPYAIVINTKNYYYKSRTFTIFHELAHIFRHLSSICIVDDINEKQREEFNCNSFAGNFLVPQNNLVSTDDLSEIEIVANKLGVSREVYLRRLKEENEISSDKFYVLLEKIKATYKIPQHKKGFVKPEVKSRATRGETFFNLVLDSLNQNRISYTQASTLLDLKINKVLREA